MTKSSDSKLATKQLLVDLAKSLYDRGYSVGGAGNISVKLDDNCYLVTPTGSSLGRLTPDQLAVVDKQGNLLEGNKPSKEVPFHLAIYQNNPDCQAIVHLHSTYLTALSCLDNLDKENALKAFTPYFVMRVGKLPVIEYFRPGSPQLPLELGRLAHQGYKAMLMANHGVVVCGKSLTDAVYSAEELEETAKLHFILQGKDIRYLTKEQLQELGDVFKGSC